MNLVLTLLINSLAIFITAYILPGVDVKDLYSALIVAIFLGIINTFIKPVLVLLTLPITIITLGLFTLVINAFLILFVSNVVPGFKVDGFWWAIIFSLVLSIVNSFLERIAE